MVLKMGAGQYASLNAMAAAAIVLLMIDPMQILSAGFQLSFAIVVGLIVLHEPLRWLLFGRWLGRRGLMVFRNNQAVRRWMWFKLGDATTSMVAMCLAAYLTAAPLVAFHFGLFSPYAALLSILVFPLVLAVLVPGYISIALAWPMPNLAGSIQQAALAAADWLAWAVGAIEQLPLLSVSLRPVGVTWTLLCYGAIIAVWQASRFRFGRTAAALLLAAVIGLGAWTQLPESAPPHGVARLDLLDVGSGQCAMIRTSSGKMWLIDAGSQSGQDVWTQILRPFLRHKRMARPDGAFISHANTDHYNAMSGLLDAGTLDTVYLNDYFGRSDQPPQSEADMINLLVDRRCEIVRLRAGSTVQLDAETNVEVLWPPASKPADLEPNDTSLVLRVACGGRRILFPGDLSRRGQQQLLDDRTDLSADILVLPHHGAWTKTLPQFVDAAAPKVILLSSSRGLDRYHSPDAARDEFIEKLKSKHRCYATSQHGWIRLKFSKEGTIRAETMHSD
ncbi:MAG: ComEC/Rec2 family competence protein [Phycisphaerae bacterium]|nr:ComEC/Rec2 family competence protein [Phycisphaerae bacterium]